MKYFKLKKKKKTHLNPFQQLFSIAVLLEVFSYRLCIVQKKSLSLCHILEMKKKKRIL